MDFGYFLHRIDHPHSGAGVDWTLLAFTPVPIDPAGFDDPATTEAIAGMTGWAIAQLASGHRDYDLVNVCLASVDEHGDPGHTLAERYHVMLDGAPVDTGTIDLRDRASAEMRTA